MKLLSCMLLLMLSASIALSHLNTPTTLETQNHTIQNSIENLLRQEKLSGAVWTIIYNDSIFTYSAGKSNLVTEETLSTDNRIHVGSITKTVLALGILRLATEKKINIDDPVVKLLPLVPIKNPWKQTNPLTIRHLLDHTSGLSDLRLWQFFSTSSSPDTPLSEFYTRNPDVLRIQSKPGDFFSYSNMGYTLLGMIIEQVTNQSYEKYLDSNLLQPLGMNSSTFGFVSQKEAHAIGQLAMGHYDDGSIAPALPIYLRPAGQFTTTASDMGQLMRFILNKGRVNSNVFIDSLYFEGYGNPDYTVASRMGLQNGYSLGASLRDRHGVVGLAHSGNIIGYKAMFYVFPNEKKGFFISHNMDSETANYEVFYKALIENLEISKAKIKVSEGSSTLALKGWEGYYISGVTKIEPLKLFDILFGFTKVTLTNDGAILYPFQQKDIELTYLGNYLFQAESRVNPSYLFYKQDECYYLTTSISNMKKISGLKIVLLGISCILGISAMGFLLFRCFYSIVKTRLKFFASPEIFAFIAIIVLLIGILLMASQNIIYLGNKNAGSVLVYLGSIMLLVFPMVSLLLKVKNSAEIVNNINFWALFLIVQFTMVLLIYGMIPFSTWS